MSQSDVLSSIVVLWLLLSGIVTLGVERRTAQQQKRPMRRWIVVINAIDVVLVVITAVLIGLNLAS